MLLVIPMIHPSVICTGGVYSSPSPSISGSRRVVSTNGVDVSDLRRTNCWSLGYHTTGGQEVWSVAMRFDRPNFVTARAVITDLISI